MTKSQIQLAWKKVMNETHKIPNWKALKKVPQQYQKVVLLRELLFICQILLNKIESGEHSVINVLVVKKIMDFYCAQMKKNA